MRVTRKIFTRAAASLFFFNPFSGDIFFSSLVFVFSLVFFYSYCFCLFAGYFFEIKNVYFDTIRLCGWMSDNKIFTRPISGNKATFLFWPNQNINMTYFQHFFHWIRI